MGKLAWQQHGARLAKDASEQRHATQVRKVDEEAHRHQLAHPVDHLKDAESGGGPMSLKSLGSVFSMFGGSANKLAADQGREIEVSDVTKTGTESFTPPTDRAERPRMSSEGLPAT